MQKLVRSMCVCFLVLTTYTAVAQLARPLTHAEIQASRPKLSKKLVHGIVGPLQMDGSQAFEVIASGGDPVWIEPVRYESKNIDVDNTRTRCGIFILSKTSPAVFIPTVGYGWMEAESCGGLQAVGFSDRGGGTPRLLLLYSAASPNTELREPVVLDWSARRDTYELNEVLSRQLEDDAEATSIAGMKKALRKHYAAK